MIPAPGENAAVPSRLIPVPPAVERPAANPAEQHRQVALRPDPVAIVDDDSSVSHSLTALLEILGFETLAYASGGEFLADERRRRLRCLILDQHMPGMDGLALLAALKAEGVSAPTILITGRLDAAIAERADRLGVLAVLEKPFSAARLVELIRGALDDPG